MRYPEKSHRRAVRLFPKLKFIVTTIMSVKPAFNTVLRMFLCELHVMSGILVFLTLNFVVPRPESAQPSSHAPLWCESIVEPRQDLNFYLGGFKSEVQHPCS
jgi:hypothetical protein